MKNATEIELNVTVLETAHVIVDAIENWLNYKGEIKIYATNSGGVDAYRGPFPSDHAYDITSINEWCFGDRDGDYDAELTSEERQGLVESFCSDWKVDSVYSPDGDEIQIVYA